MGIKKWIQDLTAPKRDISQLDDDADLDLVVEVVDTSAEPLREHHQRKAVRDRRLLPKRVLDPSSMFRRKRKKYLEAAEAARLFAESMLTRDRKIRDLLTDEEQLARYGLPIWRSEEELADALNISLGSLRFYTVHRVRDRFSNYVCFSIPKRKGGHRFIMAPKQRLKAIQRRLNDLLVRQLPLDVHAHGFRSKHSIRTGAEPHVGKALLVHLDIKDFFPSIHFGRVRGYFIAMGYGYPVASCLAMLMTEAPRQRVTVEDTTYFVPVDSRYCVQGAPTSPGLCNAIVRRLDRRLGGLAKSKDFIYTRYADDITFSGDDPSVLGKLIGRAKYIIRDEGFVLNDAKTRIMRKGQRQRVTGVTVNETIGLSRKERRILRAMIHRLNGVYGRGEEDVALLNSIRGKLAYLKMLNPEQAASFVLPENVKMSAEHTAAQGRAMDKEDSGCVKKEESITLENTASSAFLPEKLEPLPYHKKLKDYLKENEKVLWDWFSSTKAKEDYGKSVRLELLKSTYRLEASSYPELYTALEEVRSFYGIDVPLTLYQAQASRETSAALYYTHDAGHVVFIGSVLSLLNDTEIKALLGHELAHYYLWSIDDGDYYIADRVIHAIAADPRAEPAQIESARLHQLYTEIFADRGAMLITKDKHASIATLIKITSGLDKVDSESYLKQAEEIFSQSSVKTEGLTHPEAFIRARALHLYFEECEKDEAKIGNVECLIEDMIQGNPVMDDLDLIEQMQHLDTTRNFITMLLRPEWFQTEGVLAHAKLFFDDFVCSEPVISNEEFVGLMKPLDKKLKDFYCYLLLDFASVDPGLEDKALQHCLEFSNELNLHKQFEGIARKELKKRKRDLAKLFDPDRDTGIK